MLKYSISRNSLSPETKEITILNREINDIGDNDKMLSVTCYYDKDYNITTESKIYLQEYYDIQTPGTDYKSVLSFEMTPKIVYGDVKNRYFTFNIDKYFSLTINEIEVLVEDNNARLRFVFNDMHYFRTWDDEIGFDVLFYGKDNELYRKWFGNCEIEDEYTLIWNYDSKSEYMDDFMCSVFCNDTYDFVGYDGNEESVQMESVPQKACFTDEVYIKVPINELCDDKFSYYEKKCNSGDVVGLSAFRKQFFNDYSVFMDTGSIRLPVSLVQNSDITLLNEDIVMNKYVSDEIRNSINKSNEMERMPYCPVFLKSTESPETEDIFKIKFNLHFRQHRGSGWTVGDNDYWNGVNNKSITLDRMADDFYGNRFFTFSDKSKQSDLLSYLGFSTTDVKYMRNKLKKSFLRLLWYDSDDAITQNLLYYANVYIDSGKLYLKFMNNVSTYGYVLPTKGTSMRFTGAKTDMEYAPQGFRSIPDDDLEEHRLSSQIVISDLYDTETSSEGYKIYLWDDKLNIGEETDLYLKVMFNHAGYGRTIPFFMPYFDFEQEGRYGIKTFDQILYDWREDNGYGIRKFNKYSYIHFKCRYDSQKKKRVYYLDPETYGEYALYGMHGNNDLSPNELEINLYEVKVSFTNDNDR